MKTSLVLRVVVFAALLLLGSAFQRMAAADSAVPGDLWEVTSQMSMEGVSMKLPAQKVKVCSPKEWTEPPGGADERRKCTNSDFKIEGTMATWKVTCAGPPAMTGEGEITRENPESWSGSIKFTSEDGAMTLTLSGRRLDDCEKRP